MSPILIFLSGILTGAGLLALAIILAACWAAIHPDSGDKPLSALDDPHARRPNQAPKPFHVVDGP
jgi:hypothetical protein